MSKINLQQARTNLQSLVASIESGAVAEVVICRGDKPVVKLVPYDEKRPVQLGLEAGKFVPMTLAEFNRDDEYIAKLIYGGKK